MLPNNILTLLQYIMLKRCVGYTTSMVTFTKLPPFCNVMLLMHGHDYIYLPRQ